MTHVGGRAATLLVGLLVALAVAACGGSSPTGTPVPSGAAGLDGTWLLTGYVSPDGTSFTVPQAVTPTLVIEGDAASGSAGCNSFNAIATVGEGTIGFDQVVTTKMACEDPMATVEAAYMQALNLVTTWTVTADELVMEGPNGVPSLTFVRGT